MAGKQGQGLETTIKTGLRTSQLNVDLAPLLKMNASEIEERVRGELDSNPALEQKTDPDDEGTAKTADDAAGNDTAESDPNGADGSLDFGDNDDDATPSYQASNHSADDEYYGPTAIEEPSLSDYLMGGSLTV